MPFFFLRIGLLQARSNHLKISGIAYGLPLEAGI